jgi:hypothetical protein
MVCVTYFSCGKFLHFTGACRKEMSQIEALERAKDEEDKAKLNKLFS